MTWLRIAIGIFAMLHGAGHLTWFLGAWLSRGVDAAQPWLFAGGVTITSPVGRLFGATALLVAVGFVATGIALLTGATWWPPVLLVSAALSVVVVVPWWNVSPGTTVINALLANLVLVAVTLIPAARTFAHLP